MTPPCPATGPSEHTSPSTQYAADGTRHRWWGVARWRAAARRSHLTRLSTGLDSGGRERFPREPRDLFTEARDFVVGVVVVRRGAYDLVERARLHVEPRRVD